MNGVIIGIKANGERIPFEFWAYEACRNGTTNDTWLMRAFSEVVDWRSSR